MTYRHARLFIELRLIAGLLVVLPSTAGAQYPMGESGATTESSCNFGMGKGQARASCRVPIPGDCPVAHQPGTTKPWTNISKGGHVTCRFSEKETDWKTRITGVCERCKSPQCSARFAVVFDCGATAPQTMTPQKK